MLEALRQHTVYDLQAADFPEAAVEVISSRLRSIVKGVNTQSKVYPHDSFPCTMCARPHPEAISRAVFTGCLDSALAMISSPFVFG